MDEPPAPRALPDGRFDGLNAFRQAVREALLCAAQEGWNELILSDADFRDWPLGEPAVIEALQEWAGSHRRLTMLAFDYEPIRRLHPRFVPWRVRWEHLITCRKAATQDALALPSVLWTPHWMLQRIDLRRCTGVAGVQPERRVQMQQELQEWLVRKSSPGFPSSVLGL